MLLQRSRLHRDAGGAAAIEYAVIGALIGIGLIGALVGTKGSLSSVFGTAASKMAAGSANMPSSTSSRASFWAAKTLATAPVTTMYGASSITRYTYTDGTTVDFGVNPGSSNAETLYVTDPVAKTRMESFEGADTTINLFNRRDYAPDMSFQTRVASANFSNGVLASQDVTTYSAANQVSSQQRGIAVDSLLTGALQTQQADAKYFHDISSVP